MPKWAKWGPLGEEPPSHMREGAMAHRVAGHSPPCGKFSPTWGREGSWHTSSYYKRGGGVHLFTHNFRIINSS